MSSSSLHQPTLACATSERAAAGNAGEVRACIHCEDPRRCLFGRSPKSSAHMPVLAGWSWDLASSTSSALGNLAARCRRAYRPPGRHFRPQTSLTSPAASSSSAGKPITKPWLRNREHDAAPFRHSGEAARAGNRRFKRRPAPRRRGRGRRGRSRQPIGCRRTGGAMLGRRRACSCSAWQPRVGTR